MEQTSGKAEMQFVLRLTCLLDNGDRHPSRRFQSGDKGEKSEIDI